MQPEESLVFFYAKQVPLVEDTGRRVLVGAGRVLKIGPLTEYDYSGKVDGNIRSLIWERMVNHSIRPDFHDGFLLPYHEALAKCEDGLKFDPVEVIAFAPEDRFTEFSYATEHVSNDGAISALLSCRVALLRASDLFNVATTRQEQWIDRQLGRLWKKRGAFPGLGAVLTATGAPMGNFVAQTLSERVGEEGNVWAAWYAAVEAPSKHLPPELSRHIDVTTAKAWQRMAAERRHFLELMSRVDLSVVQAGILAVPEQRQAFGIGASDSDFLQNPYLLYEATRLTATPVGLAAVDRGMFPPNFVRQNFPLAAPSEVNSSVDARRLRALAIRHLEGAAATGDTLRPVTDVIMALRRTKDIDQELQTNVTSDLLKVAEEENFAGEIIVAKMADEESAYQLIRLASVGQVIRTTVAKRVEQGQRLQINVDWCAGNRRDLEARLRGQTRGLKL